MEERSWLEQGRQKFLLGDFQGAIKLDPVNGAAFYSGAVAFLASGSEGSCGEGLDERNGAGGREMSTARPSICVMRAVLECDLHC